MKLTKRNLSLDLLKIISIFMVVMLHFLGKGGVLDVQYHGTLAYNISWMIEAFCLVAVNNLVLISGYFLIDANFKVKKVLKLWAQVLFYSIGFLLIGIFIGQSINKEQLVQSIFPIITKNGYWFMTVYMCLYVLSPYINKLIKSLSKKQHFVLLTILIVIFSIIPTILPSENSLDPTMGCGIIWFITLYIVATYLKLYGSDIKGKQYIMLYIAAALILFTIKQFLECILIKMNISTDILFRLCNYNFILIFIGSTSLFMFFKDLKINKNINKKIIAFITPLTLGIYLINDNAIGIKLLYNSFYKASNYINQNIYSYILLTFGLVIGFCIVAMLIEFLRIKLFDSIGKTNLYKNIEQKSMNTSKKIINKLFQKMNL
ncbi:MAG: acyltransferase family protein [Clostridia bacterium]